MGTKRPSCTLFDTSSNINTSDRKLQPGGNVSRDPSPRPALTAQSERERDGGREDDWRRERETEKMRDKARPKDMDPRDRHYDRDRAPAPRPRDGERDWRERERRHEDGSSRNGRPLSNVERETEREVDRGMRKGDTFPRIRKHSGERDRRLTATTEMVEERGERRQRDRPKREELDDWERDREKARQREMQRLRERDETRGRPKDERQNTGRRYAEDEKGRERYREFDAGFQDERRDMGGSRDTARKREKPRPDLGQREARMPSPRRRRDREESEKAQRREEWRGTRSEGDSDEREMRRERQRERQSEEMQYQHSRSEGDKRNPTQRERDRDRQGYREEDKHRYRERYKERDRERDEDRYRRWEDEKDRERYREDQRRPAREADREKDRYKESARDTKEDRRRHERYRDYKEGRAREAKEREEDPRSDDMTSRGRQSPSETFPREPPRAQSSGEWSTTESDRDVDEQRSAAERRQREKKRSERQERDRGEAAGSRHEQRRMWLEPQRGNNSKGDFVDREREARERGMKSQAEWRREGQRGKEEPDESCWDQSSYGGRHRVRNEYRGDTERETEGVSVDAEEVGRASREMDKEGKGHLSGSDGGIEESDREEAGGSDYCVPSESEAGSDTGWKPERDRILSGEDGFVTVSSGGDEEEQFEDCREFWEGGAAYDDPPAAAFKRQEGDEKREEEWTVGKEEMGDESKPSKYIFCLIGQTLPRSETKGKSSSQVNQAKGVEIENPYDEVTWEPHADCSPAPGGGYKYPVVNIPDTKSKGNISREGKAATGETTEEAIRLQSTETREGMKHKKENPYDEIGPIKRDSQTQRLLMEWREKNKDEVKGRREQSLPLPSNPYPDIFSEVDFEQIQPILDGINTGAMSPEEVEAIRIRLSGAWSMSEEPKRHSQAPHLKWAKSVVREILGHSEEQSLTADPNAEAVKNNTQPVEIAQETGEGPAEELRMDEERSDPELEEEEPLEVEGLRGMGQGRANMHADQLTVMHDDARTYTHDDTLLDTVGQKDPSMDKETDVSGRLQSGKTDIEVRISEAPSDGLQLSEKEIEAIREKEVEMYLSVSNTLYKPSSCPLLSCETGSEPLVPSSEGEGQEGEGSVGESDEERQEEESGEGDTAEEEGSVEEGKETEIDSGEVAEGKMKGGTLRSTCSFRDLGPKARLRRRGIRKTTERRNSKRVDVKEEEGVGRDRRTRIFSTTDDEDDKSKSWGEVELRNVLDTLQRRKRNSKFFNAAQLYQQYSEAAQNFEILRQARSDVISVGGEATQSPAPSPPPARRPLPSLPQPVQHPHSLSYTGSITSIQSLPLPEPPRTEGRPSSPRLSISLSQSSTLWRELPAVRNSTELKELTEDERRLQEVRFEVVTSEASYCRSLDIVVEHFVKSKQLGALLGTQDRNWLFSRLADVRAISHSFLSKLEERVESNTMSFTVCDIIARHCQRFRMVYVPYLTNQSYQDATYQRLMNENPQFKRIVEKLERSPVCQRLPFRSFLVLPFQRITRIKLLVQNIVKRTAPGTPEATQAIKALKLLEKLIQESNDSITQMKSIESLVSLSARVDFECRTLPLVSQSRRLVREGQVTELIDFSLKDTERNIYMHLFNDYLLLSLQKDGGRFTVIDHSPVSELRVENCRVKLHSLQKNLFRLHMSHKALLLRTDTQSDKLRWISSLSRPHPETDFSAAQDFPQMQCVRTFVAQQPDELSLEKADIILVHQQSSDNWVEGTKLSDRQRGWVKADSLETITNSRVCTRNLTDAQKLTTATAAV